MSFAAWPKGAKKAAAVTNADRTGRKKMSNIFVQLFLTFAKIGLFTFGGGYAMIAMIESICVEKKRWITHDEMMNITVIAESTPGPIAINCATYVGQKQGGFLGALAATLGIVAPSFAVILIIAAFFDNFLEISLIANAFKGIKIAVGILILDAAFGMIKKMKKKALPRAIAAAAFAAMLCINVFDISFSSIYLMAICGIIGIGAEIFKPTPGEGGKK